MDEYDDSYTDGFKVWAFLAGIAMKSDDDDDLIDWDDLLDKNRDDYHEYLSSKRHECWTDYVTRKDLM